MSITVRNPLICAPGQAPRTYLVPLCRALTLTMPHPHHAVMCLDDMPCFPSPLGFPPGHPSAHPSIHLPCPPLPWLPATPPGHWRGPFGKFFEGFGAVKASPMTAFRLLRAGEKVLLFPGGARWAIQWGGARVQHCNTGVCLCTIMVAHRCRGILPGAPHHLEPCQPHATCLVRHITRLEGRDEWG